MFVQLTNPAAYPPLIHAATILSREGWRPLFLSAPNADRTLRLPTIPGLMHVEIAARSQKKITPFYYIKYCAKALSTALAKRPAIVYVSDAIAALPGLVAAKSCGAKLIYHEHDSSTNNASRNSLVRKARSTVIAEAWRIVFPNGERAELCLSEAERNDERLEIIWNVPLRSEIVTQRSFDDNRFILYYHGTITPQRLPYTVAAAINRFEGDVVLRIAGYETESGEGYLAQLISRFGSVGQGGIIDYIGQVSRHELLNVAANAHVGLALLPINVSDVDMKYMNGASNKPFDYMAAGLPLIVSDLADWRETYVTPGYGIAVNPTSTDSISEAISFLLENPDSRQSMAMRCQEKIRTDWNYETKFARIADAASKYISEFSQF